MNENNIIKRWVDASFAVHDDTKSRTGACMSLCKGTIFDNSSKQKINTTNTTHSELVGVADTLPKSLWSCLFLEAQGCIIEDINIY